MNITKGVIPATNITTAFLKPQTSDKHDIHLRLEHEDSDKDKSCLELIIKTHIAYCLPSKEIVLKSTKEIEFLRDFLNEVLPNNTPSTN